MNVVGRRLLLVVPSGTSFLTFLREVADRWQAVGGVVAVACGPDLAGHEQKAWPAGVERFAVAFDRGGGAAGTWRASVALQRLVASWRPDIVHAHFAAAVLAAGLASLWGTSHQPRWMATFHGLHATAAVDARSWLAGWAEVVSAGRMSTAWVLNREDQAFLAHRIGRGIVQLVPGYGVGCDTDHFDPRRFSDEERHRIRERLGIPPRSPVLIYVGRCVAFKGFDVAVRAFQAISVSRPNVHFIAAGAIDAVHGSGLSQTEWASVCRDSRVHLLGWQPDVAPWLAIADVCVFPSVREGMPVSVMEALAMGVPVVTSDSRGCRTVVRDGGDGLIVRERTPEGIARAVQPLLDEPDRLRGLAEEAIAGRARFDRRLFVGFQVAAYTEHLGSRPSGQA